MKPQITDKTHAVLAILRGNPGVHGYPIIQATGLQSGTVYPILARLEAARLVTSTWDTETGGVPRRCYTLTEAGKRVADAKQD